MSEWWSYRVSDLLLFSPRTYYRLIELHHQQLWPLQIVTLLAGVAILVLMLRRGANAGRVAAGLLAFLWIEVAWAFHFRRYATINWAATWFAAAFALEALLLFWSGAVRGRLTRASTPTAAQWSGAALFSFALVLHPLAGLLAGRSWTQLELFGITPDPTALATLGLVIFLGDRVRLTLLVIPLLWCVVSGATLHAMEAPDALLLPVTGALALALALRRGFGKRTTDH